MKKVTLIILLCFTSVLHSQWEYINPLVTTGDISCIRFLNDSKIILSTFQGEICTSTDRGESWITTFADRDEVLRTQLFVNENLGWVVSYYNIFKTTDGGSSWIKFNPANNQTSRYRGLYFINENIGFISKLRSLYKTTDGGLSWAMITDSIVTTFGYGLQGIYMNDENNIMICGSRNSLLRSSDGGNSWYIQALQDTTYEVIGFSHIIFSDSLTGYLIAHEEMVLKTIDGGDTWFNIHDRHAYGKTISDLNVEGLRVAYFFYDPTQPSKPCNASRNPFLKDNQNELIFPELLPYDCEKKPLILESDTMLTGDNFLTTNGGETWFTLQSYFNSQVDPRAGAFYDDSTFIIGGTDGSMILANNSGELIDTMNNFQNFYYLLDPNFFNNNHGVFISQHGFTTTRDGGKSFSYKPLNTTGYTINCFTAADTNNYFIGTYNGKVLKSTNQGGNWTAVSINVPNQQFIYKISFPGKVTGFASTYTGLHRTTDFGESWQHIFTQPIIKHDFLDSLNGYIVEGYVYKTTDGGNSFVNQGYQDAFDVSFADLNHGIVSGGFNIRYTTNGGATWHQGNINVGQEEIYEIKLVKIGKRLIGYAGLAFGGFFVSLDSGKTWQEDNFYISNTVNQFFFAENTLWASSFYSGFLVKNTFSSYIPVELINFTAKGEGNKVILNWSTASEVNNKGFEIEKQTGKSEQWKQIGFVSGNGSTLESQYYTYTDYDVEPGIYQYRLKQVDYDGTYEYSNEIEAVIELPYEFALHQNYPNPFNPTTTISYSIPTGMNKVKLNIYDILGNEIAVLVNEEKPAGEYQVEWDASVYSTGVYFYRLKAGEFTSTKKLLLMK